MSMMSFEVGHRQEPNVESGRRGQRRLQDRGSLWGWTKSPQQHRHLGRTRCCLTKVCMRVRRQVQDWGSSKAERHLASQAGAHDIAEAAAD
jgi:hypothetical protein